MSNRKSWLIWALGGLMAASAHAALVLEGTRVIYNAKEAEVTLKVSNKGAKPALAQVWLDTGDPAARPETIKVPFTLSPPVFRVDAGKVQTLRLIQTGEPMPAERESVFWLSLLDIPSSAQTPDANTLQMAFRTRVKVFYRPEGLKDKPEDAAKHLAWQLSNEAGKPALQVSNPSSYYVSLGAVEVLSGKGNAKVLEAGMLAPGEKRSLILQGEVSRPARVHFFSIGDYGTDIEASAALQGEVLH